MTTLPLTFIPDTPALTVLSLGLGQDSVAMLYAIIHHPTFRQQFCPGRLLILSSETGDEHRQTYLVQAELQTWCREHQLDYTHITPAMGFHSPNWQSLRQFYRTHHTIGSKSYNATCSSQLKISPLYRYLGHWLAITYGLSPLRKNSFIQFRNQYGPIRMLIGFSKGEERRRADPNTFPKWKRYSIEMSYPLIELGWDRTRCQQFTKGLGYPVPPPSNCMLCPYMTKLELLWLARHHPDDYQEWVELEQQKLRRWEHLGDKNYGVWGKKPLPMVLTETERDYGHLSNSELDAIKFMRGHHVQSKF